MLKSLILRLFRLGLLAGAVAGGYKLYQQTAGAPTGGETPGTGASSAASPADSYDVDLNKLGGPVNQDLLDILVCPLDKGSLEMVDGEWLVNRRNGYRYPIIDGIPVMLIEVGQKYRDESLIQSPPPDNGAAPAT